MAVKFYLSTRPDSKGEYPINVSIFLFGTRIQTSIGYNTIPAKWDEVSMRVKHGYSNSKKIQYNIINARIASIESTFGTLEANHAHLDKKQMKDQLASIIGRNIRTNRTVEAIETVGTNGTVGTTDQSGTNTNFFLPWDKFLMDGKINKKWAQSTIKKWGTLQKHIERFNRYLTLDSMTSDTLDAYVHFAATELKMIDVSIRKELTMIKWYLGWCIEKKYTSKNEFKAYKAKLADTNKPVVFLDREELMKLYNYHIPKNGTSVTLHDMKGHEYVKIVAEKSSLDKVRDLFCFCAFTSLRYSDMAQLQRTHIVDGIIHITTVKTKDKLEIPVHKFAQEILDKYAAFDFDGLALPIISNQKMNQYLKDICELCEFNEPINIVQFLAGKRRDICVPKWQVIGTHAARRSFVCNALAAGVPPLTIMQFTGHSSLKSMQPYIDVTSKAKAKAMLTIEEFLR